MYNDRFGVATVVSWRGGSGVGLAFALLIAAACAYSGPAVPVVGPEGGAAMLAGEWAGSYDFRDRGRSGSILFRLEAEADTAQGDVLMLLDDRGDDFLAPGAPDPWETAGSGSIYLNISFVRTADGVLSGALEPYVDPVCGCELSTIFEGTIEGDRVSGSFTARTPGGQDLHGSWEIDRM